jgi:hypothetical protein
VSSGCSIDQQIHASQLRRSATLAMVFDCSSRSNYILGTGIIVIASLGTSNMMRKTLKFIDIIPRMHGADWCRDLSKNKPQEPECFA